MRPSLTLFAPLVALFFTVQAHAGVHCTKLMKRRAAFAAAPLPDKIKMVTSPKAPTEINEDVVKRFWRFSLPYLVTQAQESSMILSALMSEYFSMYELIMAEVDPEKAAGLADAHAKFIEAAESLEKIKYDGKNIPTDIGPIREFMAGLQHLAQGLGLFDVLAGRTEMRVDPRTIDSPRTIRDMFTYFEDHTLDTVVADFDRVKDQIRLKELEAARLAGEEVPEEKPQAPVEYDPNFAYAVREGLPIQPGFVYQITNVRNENFDLVISKEITDLLAPNSGEKDVVYKLLRSIITGRGDKSGVKNLFDVGPGIIEVKAVFHGHKRLIGCIEGRKLRLVEMMELPDSVASYKRRINYHYCR